MSDEEVVQGGAGALAVRRHTVDAAACRERIPRGRAVREGHDGAWAALTPVGEIASRAAVPRAVHARGCYTRHAL